MSIKPNKVSTNKIMPKFPLFDPVPSFDLSNIEKDHTVFSDIKLDKSKHLLEQLSQNMIWLWCTYLKLTHLVCILVHCKSLQGFTGSLQGNPSAGISNLWGLHVYLQSPQKL